MAPSSFRVLIAAATVVLLCRIDCISCIECSQIQAPFCESQVNDECRSEPPSNDFDITLECMSNSMALVSWVNLRNLETLTIEYNCYNTLTGEKLPQYPQFVRCSSNEVSGSELVSNLEINETVHCVFGGCSKGKSGTCTKYNADTEMCSYKRFSSSPVLDQSSTTIQIVSSSPALAISTMKAFRSVQISTTPSVTSKTQTILETTSSSHSDNVQPTSTNEAPAASSSDSLTLTLTIVGVMVALLVTMICGLALFITCALSAISNRKFAKRANLSKTAVVGESFTAASFFTDRKLSLTESIKTVVQDPVNNFLPSPSHAVTDYEDNMVDCWMGIIDNDQVKPISATDFIVVLPASKSDRHPDTEYENISCTDSTASECINRSNQQDNQESLRTISCVDMTAQTVITEEYSDLNIGLAKESTWPAGQSVLTTVVVVNHPLRT